jgi:hypothetical protein
MKKKIVYILTLAAVSIGCFFVGRNTAEQSEPETHVERMEYALENISRWKLADDGETVILYDFEGNIYNW